MRKIAVLTGKRGGFGAMKPMLRRIVADPELELTLVVTDQHLDPAFGATIAEVEREFPVAARIEMGPQDGSALARARALGACLTNMAGALAELAPDVLVLYGDRGEVLAAATAAIHLRIPIAHVQGGDVTGNVDELIRHAVTKLAHLHFPATAASAARIQAMGEEAWRVHVVGDNHLDCLIAGEYTPAPELRCRYEIGDGEMPILVLLHPETTARRDSYADARFVFEAVLAQCRRTIMVYPCSDHGYDGIVRALDEVRDRPGVSVHKNIEAHDFWGLMAIASVIVGNSSAALIETPTLRLPAINVGERQRGRLRAGNVLDVPFETEAITAALRRAFTDRATLAACDQPFGDGHAGERIVNVLATVELGPRLFDKRLVSRDG
jgi:UDP-N-acetylglucosamine 2-epimerase (non-hydrolysing)/GDP/UDP-N,N'-diacetylbacillosamine 2-epimerase (hydrolysing)